ncbi:MAG TPA: rhodanese-like domain-containing protein [Thioploca sp.]|nr:rhodanese-like domain-containing protein [Thioploca sp.]
MKSFQELVNNCLKTVKEVFPWDLPKDIDKSKYPVLLDIREPYEFEVLHIKGSMNVPRGILELACDYGYDDTIPELVKARNKEVIVICRSGHRSVLAAHTMQIMGYKSVKSLKTGVKGWNDYELPLQNVKGQSVDSDLADDMLASHVKPEQKNPN